MKKLNKEEIEFITKCLKENKPLPDNYSFLLKQRRNKSSLMMAKSGVSFCIIKI